MIGGTPARTIIARSISRAVRPLIDGEEREGIALGRGYVDVGGYVLALTEPGAPRMPNGVECALKLEPGERVTVGGGVVHTAAVRVLVDREWDPVPRARVGLRVDCDVPIDAVSLAGRGAGLTPAGDDLLAGYAAGLVLFHGRRDEARALVEAACPRTTALSATLLRHAANGELPEPAHDLLERGEAAPLLRWGRSSGHYLMLGLAIAYPDPGTARMRRRKGGGVTGEGHFETSARST